MKRSFILICVISLFSLSSTGQKTDKDYILALSVELYMNTSAQVSCDNFATAFKSELHVSKIVRQDSLVKFTSFVSNVKYARQNRGIDVRRKFIYESKDEDKIVVCASANDILVDGRLIKPNKAFIDFLNSLVK